MTRRGRKETFPASLEKKGVEIYLILESLNVLYIQCFIIYSQQRLYV